MSKAVNFYAVRKYIIINDTDEFVKNRQNDVILSLDEEFDFDDCVLVPSNSKILNDLSTSHKIFTHKEYKADEFTNELKEKITYLAFPKEAEEFINSLLKDKEYALKLYEGAKKYNEITIEHYREKNAIQFCQLALYKNASFLDRLKYLFTREIT